MSYMLSFVAQFHEEIGFLLMPIVIIALFLKNDKIVIYIFTIVSFIWTALFVSIGSYTAGALVFVTGVRMAMCRRYFGNYWLTTFFVLVYIGLSVITYETIKDIFPVIGSILGTISFMHFRKIEMRLVLIVASLAWAIHNYMAGFISATLYESVAMGINAFTIYRIWLEDKDSLKNLFSYRAKVQAEAG